MIDNKDDLSNAPQHIWFYVLVVFITQLDGGAVSTLLPAISQTFRLSSLSSSWVAGIYTLGLIIGTPITANLSDIYGTKRIFLGELTAWFIGCLLTALSVNYPLMLAGRLIQALGDSGIIVLSMTVLLKAARREQQGRKVSLIGIVSGISAIAAPIIAGIILGRSNNWRIFYYGLLPVLVILFILSFFLLHNQANITKMKTDFKGLGTFTCALMTLMLAVTFSENVAHYWILVVILFTVAIISFLAFLKVEKRISSRTLPFLPVNLFKLRAYTLTLLLGTLGGMLFSLFVYIPTYVHTIFGLPLRLSGMTLVGTGIGSVVGSWLGGWLVDKFGNRKTLLVAGVLLSFSGLAIIFTLNNLQMFMAFSFILGIGLGCLMSAPLQVVAGRLARADQGMQAIGGLSAAKKIGTTIAPLLFASAISLGNVRTQMTIGSFRNMFIVAVVIAVLCLVLTLAIPFNKEKN